MLSKKLVIFVLILYFFLLLFLLLFNRSRLSGQASDEAYLVPLVHTFKAIFSPKPNDFWVLLMMDLIGNALIFIPLGILSPFVFPSLTPKRIFILSLFFSLAVELAQYSLKLGVFDANDILLNSLGAYAGSKLLQRYSEKGGQTNI